MLTEKDSMLRVRLTQRQSDELDSIIKVNKSGTEPQREQSVYGNLKLGQMAH